MAVDVYFKQDILNVLRATYAAGDGPAALLAEFLQDSELGEVPLDKLLRVYRQGFNTALGAIGLAFGLDGHPAERRSCSFPVSSPTALDHGHALPKGLRPELAVDPESLRSTAPEPDLVSFLWASVQLDR